MANQLLDSDIPVLEDMILFDSDEDTKPPAAAPVTESTKAPAPKVATGYEFNTSSKPLPRNNPFLPYEHLEQLAKERAEFQKQFLQFAEIPPRQRVAPAPLQAPHSVYQPYQSAPFTAQQRSNDSSQTAAKLLDNLVRQITQEIVSELRPQIEIQVRAKLHERGDIDQLLKR